MFYAPRKSGTTGVVVTTPKEGKEYRRTAIVILDGSVACPPFEDISGEDLRKIVDFVQVYWDTFHKESRETKPDEHPLPCAKVWKRTIGRTKGKIFRAKCAARKKEIYARHVARLEELEKESRRDEGGTIHV